jgi:hypothetical protein
MKALQSGKILGLKNIDTGPNFGPRRTRMDVAINTKEQESEKAEL